MKLRKLAIKNMLPFGEAKIDFSKYGMLLIAGDNGTPGTDSNGSGKSAVLDLIAWALFGKLLRKIPKDDVIRYGCTNGQVVLSFSIGDEVYRVRRYRGANNRVEFAKKAQAAGLPPIDLTAKTPTETQAEIEGVIGMDFDTFRSVAYFGQRDVSVFADGTSADRLKIVGKILRIHIVERAAKLARDRAARFQETCDRAAALKERATEALQETFGGSAREGLEGELERLQEALPGLEDELEEKHKVLGRVARAAELRAEADEWQEELDERRGQRVEELDELNKTRVADEEKAGELGALEERLDAVLAEADKVVREYPENSIDLAIEAAQEAVTGSQAKIASYQANRKSLDSRRRKLLGVLDREDSVCPTCRRVIDVDAGEAIEAVAAELDEKSQGHSRNIKVRKRKLTEQAQVALRLQEEKRRLVDLKEQGRGLQSQVEGAKAAGEHLAAVTAQAEVRRDYHKERITVAKAKLLEAQEACKGLPTGESDISMLKDEVELAKRRVHDASSEIGSLTERLSQAEALVAEIDRHQEDIVELGYEIKRARYWADGFPRIRLLVVDSFIPEFEAEVNRYLERLFPSVRVRFETVVPLKKGGTDEKFEIFITDLETGRESSWDSWSGGEKKRMALALYLGLNAVASRAMESRIGFLMLDEVLADLDVTGRQAVLELFEAEREQDRSIVLISHLPGIQQSFPDVLTVVKRDGIASVRE